MFKSSFAKYLVAFVLIILMSFIMLSGIITSIIRNYVSDQTEVKLGLTASLVSDHFIDKGVESIVAPGFMDTLSSVIVPIINFDTQYDILVADSKKRVVLSTVGEECINDDGTKSPITDVKNGYTTLDLSDFKSVTGNDGEPFLRHRGDLDGFLDEPSLVYCKEVVISGQTRGYVLSLSSTVEEDKLVEITRSAVINSSIWVMLAAVIATYFITERIIHPLRTMTSASKKFAKGDFSARVTVYGNDEVAELGKAFNNMAESLDSLEKMRISFLANISHDLRTPMTTISGFIDGITSGAIPPEKHDYYLGVISAEVHRLSRLVSQILDVSRLESGERKFSFTDFDVAEVARIILISFEKKIEDKKLEVEFNVENDMMMAFADKDAIYQVLYNLCHNAIKFAKEGGRFIISISKISSSKLRITVYDDGESISEEDTKMVFDRFYKTDKSRGLDKNGVGLGLYICKTIVDAHGESIGVESYDNKGCEFWFTLTEGTQISKRKPID